MSRPRQIVALLCFLVLSHNRCSAESFKSAKLLPVNAGVKFVQSADVNGDGKLDLIYTTIPTSSVQSMLFVALGNGDGTFAMAASVQIPNNFNGAFALADVNKDGKIDILALTFTLSSVPLVVLLGNGDGTFQPGISSALPLTGSNFPGYSQAMGVGDFNGDGAVDIVIGDVANDYLVLLLGDNTGHFTVKNSWFDGDNPFAIYAADLNGDGHLDFVAHGANSARALVYLGNGDGTFQPRVIYTGPDYVRSLLLKDMNHDGHLDLVITGNSGTVEILLGHADGTFDNFSSGGSVYAGIAPVVIDVADFNGDGTLDIATTSQNGIGILLGQANLSYQGPVNFPVAPFPYQVAYGDFNGDGHTDFAVATPDGIGLLFGNSDGTLQSADAYDVQKYLVASVALGDFNGDGFPDLAVGVQGGLPQILQGHKDGTFNLLPDQTQTPYPGYGGGVYVGDFNGDHKLDVLDAGNNGYVEFGKGDGTFVQPPSAMLDATNSLAGASSCDLNGDGFADVILANFTALISQPDHTFHSTSIPIPQGFSPETLACGDFNHDGKMDIAIYGSVYNGAGVVILLGDGTGSFVAGPLNAVPYTGSPSMALGDVDGDGKMDVVLPQNTITPGFQILYGNGDGTLQNSRSYATLHPVIVVAVGDLNLDGVTDMILSDGNVVSVLHGTGNRSFGTARDYLAGDSPSSPIVADVNGDGAPDLIFANSETNGVTTVSVLLNLGVTTGVLNIVPSPAEYGEAVAISATYTATVPAAGLPTGDVAFSVDSSAAISAQLQNGTASVTENQILALGNHSVSATWPGDSTFNAHNLSGQFQVKQASTTTSLTATPSVAVAGQTVSLAANVVPHFQGVPTGSIQFLSGSTALKTVALDSADSATYSIDTTSLALGNYSYSAVYSGDTNFLPSTSPVQQLKLVDYTVSVSPTAVTVIAGNQGNVTVTVSSTSGFNGTVNLSCAGLPANAACSFANSSLSLANAASASTALSITTTRATFALPQCWPDSKSPAPFLSAELVVLLCSILSLAALAGRKRQRQWVIFAGFLVLASVCLASGCGGGGGGGGGGTPPTTTPYTISVQATVNGSSPAVSRTLRSR